MKVVSFVIVVFLISSMISNCVRTKLAHSRVSPSFTCVIHTSAICMKDHYKTLQVESTASSTEIKEAYLHLSKLYHPDVNPHENAKIMFQELTEAYEVLGNEKGRHEYDHKCISRLQKIRHKSAKTREKDTDRRSYAEIHEKIKKVYQNDEELFKEWASRDEENTRRFFKEHMYGECEDERRERDQRRAKDKHKKDEAIYKAMVDNREKIEIRFMKQLTKVLVIGLVGALLLEKLSSS